MPEAAEPQLGEIKKISENDYQQMLDKSKVLPAPEVKPLSKKPEEKKPDVSHETKLPEQPADKVKPETGEENPEEKKPETKPTKKFRERIKGDFFSDVPKTDKPAEVNITELQSKYEAAQKELQDKDYLTWKAIKEKGKKSIDVLQEVVGVNPDKMSDEEVFRYDLQKAGITDPEKVQNEIDAFFGDSTTERARVKELQTIRNSIRKDSDAVQSEFFNKITAPDPNAIKERERFQKDAESFQTTVQASIDQEVYGLKVTSEMADRVIKRIENNELIPKKDDGSLDTKRLYQMLFLSEYVDAVFDNLEKTVFAEGVHTIADEYEATPGSDTQKSRPPEIHHKIEKGTEEYAREVSTNLKPYNPQ